MLREAPKGAPQHEVDSRWHLETLLILRRPQSGRLEGRTSVVQPQAADADGGMGGGSTAGDDWCAAAGARGPWRPGLFRPLGRRVLALVPRCCNQLPALSRPTVDARDHR